MATRARILSAARRLSRTGERPTLGEVAQAAGVSRATVHRVVGSRADLLTAIDADPDPATRDRVLQAALELVGHNGLSGLSMDELAAQAGTSRANLYRLFPGKAALFRELVAAYSPLQPVLEVAEGWLRAMKTEAGAWRSNTRSKSRVWSRVSAVSGRWMESACASGPVRSTGSWGPTVPERRR